MLNEITSANFEHFVLQSRTPVLVVFTVEWAGVARKYVRTIEQLDLEATFGVRVAVVNGDNATDLTNRYGIHGYPEIVFFSEGRARLSRRGATDGNDVQSWIRQRLDDEGQRLRNAGSWIAIGILSGRLRVVSLERDGRYSFVDDYARAHRILRADEVQDSIVAAKVVEEFESLINTRDISEGSMHAFLQRHPDFITGSEYRVAHSQVVLQRDNNRGSLVPDFVLEPVDSDDFCDLLELKRPAARLFVLKKNRMRFSAAVVEAIAQLREYSRFFDQIDQRDAFYRQYGLRAFKPKLFVILGRSGAIDSFQRREAAQEFPDVVIRGFDDLLRIYKRNHGMGTR